MSIVLQTILRRWWMLYGVGFLFLAAMAAWLGDPGTFVPALAPAVLLAVLPTQMDRQSGRLKYWQALPVTEGEVVGAYWAAAVLVPAAIIAFSLVGTLGLWSLFSPVRPEAAAFQSVLVPLSPLICGACWFLLLRTHQSVNGGTRMQQVWSVAYGLTVGGCFFAAYLLPPAWSQMRPHHAVLIAALAIATGLGWRDRQTLLMPVRPPSRRPGAQAEAYPAANRWQEGWLGYWQGGITGSLALTASWLIMILVMGTVLRGGGREGMVAAIKATAADSPSGIAFLWAFAAVMGFIPLRHLRALRVMPISTRTLVGWMLGLPWLYGALVSVEVWAVARLFGIEASLVHLLLYGSGVIAVAITVLPIVLRWGLTTLTMVIIFAFSQMVILAGATHFSVAALFLPLLASTLLCAAIVIRQLDRASTPYRGSLVHLAGWDRR